MNDEPRKEQAAEQVLDYFLQELISGQPPPDLLQRITAAWSREQAELTGGASRAHSAHGARADQFSPSSAADAAGTSPSCAAAAGPRRVIARPVRGPTDPAESAGIAPLHVVAQPVTAQPTTTQPTTAQPITTQKVAAQPVIARAISEAAPRESAASLSLSPSMDREIPLRRHVIAFMLATGACGLLTLLSWHLIDPDRVMAQRLLELARAEAQSLVSPPLVSPASPARPSSELTSQPQPASSPAANASSEAATGPRIAQSDAFNKQTSGEEAIVLFPLDRPATVDGPSDPAASAANALQTSAGKLASGDVTSPAGSQPMSGQLADGQPLDSQQIVAQIDQRLARVWQELSVTPSPKFDDAQRAQQVSLTLTGQPASGTVGDLDALIARATASLPFARQWADRFVNVWLAGSDLSADDARVQTLKQHFAESIYEGRPWNATALDLLGGPLAVARADAVESPGAKAKDAKLNAGRQDASRSQDASPALASAGQPPAPAAQVNPIGSAFVGALAGEGNHRLLAHIGTNFLDVDLSCVRCHDASSSSVAAQGAITTEAAEQLAERQAMYWSLAAMLQGIDAQALESGERVLVDRQAELLAAGKPLTAYYDLIDGRLQAAEPRLPDGKAWETIAGASVPRQALAQWLSQSAAMDDATVNQVWRMVFGQSLASRTPVRQQLATPETPVAEQSSLLAAERQQRELLEFLSNQYRAHGHDLKQLVGWIVRSDAFRRQPVQPSRSQWLAASEDELRKWHVARASFASGARTSGAASDHSLESSLAMVLQWRERSNSAAGTALAQPVPNLAPAQDSASSASNAKLAGPEDTDSATGLKDGVRLTPPTAVELAFVDRLLNSQRLSWQDYVAHIVCLTPEVLPNDRIHFLANELLRHHKGDERAALLDLLWAVKR